MSDLRDVLDQWSIDSMAACAGYDGGMMQRINAAVERRVVDFCEAADFYCIDLPGFGAEKLHSVLAYIKAEHNEARFKYYHRGDKPRDYESLKRMHDTSDARYLIQEVLEREFGEEFEQ